VYVEQLIKALTPPEDGCGAEVARPQLLERYQAIAQASQAMLEAARRADWDEVGRLEECCRTLIAALKLSALAGPLTPDDEQRRMQLLQRILADDAEIRDRSEPWLRQLDLLLATPRSRRLDRPR
jgi:flagellar protein FliT